ncbi:MAG: DUF2095 family protein [Candidatus Hydrothermarchaeaceae archaeon]
MKDFKKKYPNLARELEEGEFISIESVRSNVEEAEGEIRGEPTVVDFLRRCDTDEQGMEIIRYMKKQNQISDEYAAQLTEQLVKHGIRSFGPKKRGIYR